jgi:hypothetical protein
MLIGSAGSIAIPNKSNNIKVFIFCWWWWTNRTGWGAIYKTP